MGNAQKNSDDWQSKHRLLQDDIETVKQALTQEKATCEETKQLMITNKLEQQNKYELLEEKHNKVRFWFEFEPHIIKQLSGIDSN